ncbi:MAG: hypothetical protein AAFP81_00920 [Pseudomonadota bacterium]
MTQKIVSLIDEKRREIDHRDIGKMCSEWDKEDWWEVVQFEDPFVFLHFQSEAENKACVINIWTCEGHDSDGHPVRMCWLREDEDE